MRLGQTTFCIVRNPGIMCEHRFCPNGAVSSSWRRFFREHAYGFFVRFFFWIGRQIPFSMEGFEQTFVGIGSELRLPDRLHSLLPRTGWRSKRSIHVSSSGDRDFQQSFRFCRRIARQTVGGAAFQGARRSRSNPGIWRLSSSLPFTAGDDLRLSSELVTHVAGMFRRVPGVVDALLELGGQFTLFGDSAEIISFI